MSLPTRRPFGPTRTALLVLACGLWPAAIGPVSDGPDASAAAPAAFVESDLWLLPSTAPVPAIGAAVADLHDGHPERALAVFIRAAGHPVLGAYARFYQGRAELALERSAPALTSARHVIAASPDGHLGEAALWLMADAAEASERWPEARQALDALTKLASSSPARVAIRLARVANRQGDRQTARAAFAKIHFEYPLSPEAAESATELAALGGPPAAAPGVELARAEVLFAGRRYAEARRAYDALVTGAGIDRALVRLRRAQCDFHLGRHEAARTALRSLLATATTHRAEAAYYELGAVRALRRETEYRALVRSFVRAYPGDALAETALNDLATHFILANDDEAAVHVFEELLERFPSGAFADRAAWKAGWWAYRNRRYEHAIRLFETAITTFPRADYRPAWLYWAARAEERLGRSAEALAAYGRTVSFYRNLYYGREAERRANSLRTRLGGGARRTTSPAPAAAPLAVPTDRRVPGTLAPLIQHLLAAGLYDDAIGELRRVARSNGSSSFIDATIAYALNRKGELRPAITTMRRAYPEFMAAGGEALPVNILKVIYPLEYWEGIQQEARRHRLDPYLVAALVAQESTFQADVRSSANAWGLMQILPATGRRYATRIGIPRFTTARLTDPAVNLRIGTTYLADLRDRFGDIAHALAAYNAGENRVERWRAERPGLERDEFVDDIPFPETQNYVKRILGTTEDYRLLYGDPARP